MADQDQQRPSTPRILLLMGLVGCVGKLPPAPAIEMAAMEVDRDELPAVELRGAVVATTKMSRHLARDGAEPSEERGPISAFVVTHPERGVLLIDTGYPRRSAVDTRDYPGKLTAKLLELEIGTPLADLLPDIGKSPEDVTQIFLTHLHTDHAGGIEDFPDATLWIDPNERSFASHRRTLKGVDPRPFAHRPSTPPLYKDGPWGPFEQHTDVFQDGTILLIPAYGHTPGSMMVVVNTPQHSWLFTGDVTWTDDNLGVEPRPKGAAARLLLEHDWKAGLDPLHRLQTLLDREDLTIITGHEPINLERLPAWPEVWTTRPW